MSDRTSATVTIYDAPGKLVEIAEVLDDRGYSIDWESVAIDATKPVELGQVYTAHEMSLGEAPEVVEAIRELFEDEGDCLVIVAQTDPAYEYLGDFVLHTPFGDYTHECASGGDLVFTESEVRKAVDEGTIDDLLGKKYFDYLHAYRKVAS